MTRLYERQVRAEKSIQPDGQWLISVDSSQTIEALKQLDDGRVIRPEVTSIDKASIVSSREDQRFRYERALSREIERTISSLSGVLESHVHLNLPPVDPLFNQPLNDSHGSASVLIIAEPQFQVTRAQIAELVSGASGIGNASVLISVADTSKTTTDQKIPGTIDSRAPTLETKAIHFGMEDSLLREMAAALLILALGVLIVVARQRRKSRALSNLNLQFNEAGI